MSVDPAFSGYEKDETEKPKSNFDLSFEEPVFHKERNVFQIRFVLNGTPSGYATFEFPTLEDCQKWKDSLANEEKEA